MMFDVLKSHGITIKHLGMNNFCVSLMSCDSHLDTKIRRGYEMCMMV